MKTPSFTATAAIKFGWDTFKKDKLFWIVAAVLQLFVLSGPTSTNMAEEDESESCETANSVQQGADPEPKATSNRTTPENMSQIEQGETTSATPEQAHAGKDVTDVPESATPLPSDGSTAMYAILFVIFVLILPIAILVTLLYSAVQLGFLKFYLTAGRGQETKYDIILSEIHLGKSFRFLVASLLYILVVALGLLLLVVPGIYFAIRLGFFGYAIVDQDASISGSFRLSSEITKGYKWRLFFLWILLLLLNLAGLLALFYGLLVTAPLSFIAGAYVYDRLSQGVYEGA